MGTHSQSHSSLSASLWFRVLCAGLVASACSSASMSGALPGVGSEDGSSPGPGDSSSDGVSGSGEEDGAAGVPGGAAGAPSGAAGAPSTNVPPKVPPPGAELTPTGQLTAGIFDDNLSFGFFSKYLESRPNQLVGKLPISPEEFLLANAEFKKQRPSPSDLDLSLVVDTTGSMGDELEYLKDELGSLSEEIAARFPNASQRWSLVVYRDEGDEYLTRQYDFTEDLQAFQATLTRQTYDGGGDFPEAPEQGILASRSLSWRDTADVAKLMFLIADAPHHDENREAMASAILGARDQDVHIYPVASSGVDELTELTFRQAAQLTLGRYIFLTDDSGIGNSHKEPTLPCYYVTTLKKAILRGVEAELTGSATAPTPAETVRFVGGLNEAGNCFFGDGFSSRPF